MLDGATGTELERRGAPCALPLWSTGGLLSSPDLVREIHADYARAGCDLLTAATFRTQGRVLAQVGLGGRAASLTTLAVRLAREAGPDRTVLGSAPPLEDCYHPERVPADDALAREHEEHAGHLATAGADGILAETHNTAREARAAARAAGAVGLPVWVSFVCDGSGRLLSGEPLEAGLEAVAGEAPLGVGVNCLPADAVDACLPVLEASGLPFLVSANLGAPVEGAPSGRSDPLGPDELAARARGWIEAGAEIVGGCCGTRPEHLAALARLVAAHGPRIGTAADAQLNSGHGRR